MVSYNNLDVPPALSHANRFLPSQAQGPEQHTWEPQQSAAVVNAPNFTFPFNITIQQQVPPGLFNTSLTLSPLSLLMSMMERTVSYRMAFPTFLEDSVLVATCARMSFMVSEASLSPQPRILSSFRIFTWRRRTYDVILFTYLSFFFKQFSNLCFVVHWVPGKLGLPSATVCVVNLNHQNMLCGGTMCV